MISDVALLASDRLSSSFASKIAQAEATKDMEIDSDQTDRLWVDPASCCYALYSKLDADKVLLQPSPLSLSKALKVIMKVTSLNVFIVLCFTYVLFSLLYVRTRLSSKDSRRHMFVMVQLLFNTLFGSINRY